MLLTEHVQLMAKYNAWMNGKIYASAEQLSAQDLAKDRKAFFGSVIGSLNHIIVADIIWLKRFAVLLQTHQELDAVRQLNQPPTLDATLFTSLPELYACRTSLDETIIKLGDSLTEQELCLTLSYTNTKGVASAKRLFSVLMHFFNHQTHHRGQITTLLSQSGIDVGVTDLVTII